jgi:hypothetical protein
MVQFRWKKKHEKRPARTWNSQNHYHSLELEAHKNLRQNGRTFCQYGKYNSLKDSLTRVLLPY